MENHHFCWKTHYKWPFSIAMLVISRGYPAWWHPMWPASKVASRIPSYPPIDGQPRISCNRPRDRWNSSTRKRARRKVRTTSWFSTAAGKNCHLQNFQGQYIVCFKVWQLCSLYPLVSMRKTMENHNFQSENSLFLWPLSLVYKPQ